MESCFDNWLTFGRYFSRLTGFSPVSVSAPLLVSTVGLEEHAGGGWAV